MNVINSVPAIEFESPEKIAKVQLHELQKLLRYTQANSPFYQLLFKNSGIDALQIDSFQAFSRIPFTSKDELARFPDDFLCVPKSEIADFTTTSGTLGNPVTVCLTANDVDRLAYNEAISMLKAGCSSDDIFQLATTMDKRFMAGLAYCEGVRKLNAGLIRVGASAPSLQWDSIQRFEPTVLIAIPSFVLALIDFAKKNGINIRKSSLKKLIAIGQPVRDKELNLNVIGQRIQDEWGLEIYSTYASTEMGCAFTECEAGAGGHLNPDLLYLEMIDEAGNLVGDGETGEVVITTLGIEGMPLLRYRTGDLATIYQSPCSCGRTTPRLGPIIGRKQQMIKFKGTTVHPSSIVPILDANKEFGMYLIELVTDELGLDGINIIYPEEEVSTEKAIEITVGIGEAIKVRPDFKRMPKDELRKMVLDPSSRKPIKILDNRKNILSTL